MKRPVPRIASGILVLAHLAAAGAGFLAPYRPEEQHRDHPWRPPASLEWRSGALWAVDRSAEPHRATQFRWWVETPSGRKLFAAPAGESIFLLGTDGLGRDQWTRLLYGARISLYSGLAAAVVAAATGWLLGGLAGFLGGWLDRLLTVAAEAFLALPWMYLLLAARAFFPLRTDPQLVFSVLLLLLGIVGWARPARLVRGAVMSAKERDYVHAARGFGAGRWYLLTRHVLPETSPIIFTWLSLAIPQYIAAEATLSFLGLGLSGSVPSWGGLIAGLGSLEVLVSYWWMWAPAVTLTTILACYHSLAASVSRSSGDTG